MIIISPTVPVAMSVMEWYYILGWIEAHETRNGLPPLVDELRARIRVNISGD